MTIFTKLAEHWTSVISCHRRTTPRMIGRHFLRLLAVVTAISLPTAVALAGSAFAAPTAYPPVPPRPPRARCAISTIVDRRVAIICNAGRLRAHHRAAIRIGNTIVAHGFVGATGLYVARFTLRTRLVRGTLIRFLVLGRIVATLRA